ncbi:MAG: hypothetical protein DDT34_00203 [Firmicutes bacterium]|nr:hypothetical protein [Bacillota bacterium]
MLHALGVIDKDGLTVLFWTGDDAVGANEIVDDGRVPEQAWQIIQQEGMYKSSLLAEIVSS